MPTPYIHTDRFEELDHIDLNTVFGVLKIHCANFQPDIESCLVFLLRILRDKDAANHPDTRDWVTHLIRKIRDHGPFNRRGLELAFKLTNDQDIDARLERLRYFDLPPEMLDFRSVMSSQRAMRRKRELLQETLDRMPGHVLAASQLLQLDAYEGHMESPWLEKVTIPKFFEAEWNQRLFQHHASVGSIDRAMELLPRIAQSPLSEIQLNLAAELYAASGSTEQALHCYRESLKLDPHQLPVRHRLAELETPFVPDNERINIDRVCICVYTWNKAEDLERTLASLAQTDIGSACIRILLNGCTDNSLQIVKEAQTLFPDNDFKWIEIPVNIGAPAARNWLASLSDVRESDFVAYIDDDVELPRDWLAHFLTVMYQYPDTSVVGCKVVYGNNTNMLQYLHRTFSLAQNGLIKLSNPNQIAESDRGQYNFIRTTDHVMGCCHLLRMDHFPQGINFDIRYSPSQIDDIAHDIKTRVNNGVIRYCGLVTCVHHQNTGGGFKRRMTDAQVGQVMGNDMKLYHQFEGEMDKINSLMSESAS